MHLRSFLGRRRPPTLPGFSRLYPPHPDSPLTLRLLIAFGPPHEERTCLCFPQAGTLVGIFSSFLFFSTRTSPPSTYFTCMLCSNKCPSSLTPHERRITLLRILFRNTHDSPSIKTPPLPSMTVLQFPLSIPAKFLKRGHLRPHPLCGREIPSFPPPPLFLQTLYVSFWGILFSFPSADCIQVCVL